MATAIAILVGRRERTTHGALVGVARVLGSTAAALAGGSGLLGVATAAGYAIWPECAGLAAWLGFATAVLIGFSAARQDRAAWMLTVVLCASLTALVGSVGIGTTPLANPVLAGASLAIMTAFALLAAGLTGIFSYAITRAATELSPDRI